jgi:hypothetical protein
MPELQQKEQQAMPRMMIIVFFSSLLSEFSAKIHETAKRDNFIQSFLKQITKIHKEKEIFNKMLLFNKKEFNINFAKTKLKQNQK